MASDEGLRALGVPAERGPIYELALTHRSFAFEDGDSEGHNERLEFLGDAILEAVVTSLIFRSYPNLAEGEMARLRASVVNTEALARIARELALGEVVRLGKGEETSGGREKSSILANVFEALIGAVFVDRGISRVEESLTPIFEDKILVASGAGRFDTKTALQEVVVRRTGELPSYRVAASGPDHDKTFIAHVYAGDELCGSGTGRSKKDAEQKAAREALDKFQAGGGADARAS